MKITYNINLDGRVFTIDEDAYRLLDDYLETLKHAFNNSENKEIVADIEARISEVFFINQEEGKSVVTLQDVEAVITRIGHPEELIEEVDETVVEEGEKVEVKVESVLPPPPPIQAPKPVKRLYRDSSNGMIGGVCAGLAEYLNVDVTWVRLIAVALCFVSLSTLALAYLILWIVLPNAETPYQRMQMSGESPTLQNIGQSVNNFFKRRN
ncbi:MAG: PspC domain-containing protein [Muribaculaceae bacterium]|nr:PspC domain-containing protein [Muribaculaceae bacterium]